MPKPLFHRSENFGLAMRLGIDDPIGMKPNSGESRREKVASPEAPQDRAFVARENAGHEQVALAACSLAAPACMTS